MRGGSSYGGSGRGGDGRVADIVLEGEVVVRELEVPLVVELGQRRRVGVLVLEVQVVALRVGRRVATLLAHVDLVPALLVRVVVSDAVHFQRVRLQGTALGEGLVTVIAFVGTHTCCSVFIAPLYSGQRTYLCACACGASGRTCH